MKSVRAKRNALDEQRSDFVRQNRMSLRSDISDLDFIAFVGMKAVSALLTRH